MGLSISNGRVEGVAFVPARCSGGAIKPELIVVHDTAGRLEKGNSVSWFKSSKCETSAHFVVERDGTIVQMVRCDRKAFHAGKSVWKGRQFCNSFSIGIEIVNPGKLDANGKAYFGRATDDPVIKKKTKEHGDGYWLPYTDEQIEATSKLCRAIIAEYPDCNEITTHWAISPGRKIDTNPLFPLADVKSYAFGENEDEEIDTGIGATPADAVGELDQVEAVAPGPVLPTKTMAESKTGNTSIAVGGSSSLMAVQVLSKEAREAAASAVSSDGTFSVLSFVTNLLASELFMTSALALFVAVGGCMFIWLDRRDKMRRHGI